MSRFMEKTLPKILATIVILVLFTAPHSAYAYYDEDYTPRDLETWLQQFDYDHRRLRHSKITGNCYALSVDAFIENGGGICKDFAYVSAHLLQNMGYKPWIMIYHVEDGKWHAVTMFYWEGELWYFSNYNLKGRDRDWET